VKHEQTSFASRVGGIPTGLKMLLILSLGLLPLGLIAILASIESARENHAEHYEEIEARAQLKAQRIESAVARSVLMLRAASAASDPAYGPNLCSRTLARLSRAEQLPGRFALYSAGTLRCATPGYNPPAYTAMRGETTRIEITPDGGMLRFAVFDERGWIEGSGAFSRESLAQITDLPGGKTNYDLILSSNGRRMILRQGLQQGALERVADVRETLADGRLELLLRASTAPLSAPELLISLLPVIMWIAAAVIGWIIVDRLILRPLVGMQRAIAAYQPGDSHFALPPLSSPAREIGELGLAFSRVTQTVARHEADLEAGLERQTRLVREVHHRVKNNLQVVASLLNLHARGAASEDVAAAYASIQRRVDALAVVHRNHYAELEENRGVALKSLISELGANLRANAPKSASNMQVRLDIEPYYATQDVAVSIAFLVTEVVEFAMFCGARAVTISLEGIDGATARLAIESEALRGEVSCDEKLTERFERIVTGLGRQLRSTIDRDHEAGRYAVNVAVVDKGEL
jgi:two-component system, sensor histidine kinase PdtaS